MIDRTIAPNLRVRHGFLGRVGGVSTGELRSLNCGTGSGDEPALIAENRARALAAVAPGARLMSVYQIHSGDCVTVAEPWDDAERPRADALVTDRPGLALSILTADCAPVLLADAKAGVIGVAHAGWKGALGGVTEATVGAMRGLGARDIAAAVGPCIGQASYEVDDAFAARIGDASFFAPGRPGHAQFDLEGYVAHRLERAGVADIWRAGLDTLALPARYFSYRRATLAGEGGYGRQISLIALD